MDNYFCSVPLMMELEKLMIGSSGTVRQNRKNIPQGVKDPGEMGEHITKIYKTGNLAALVWKDKKTCEVYDKLPRRV